MQRLRFGEDHYAIAAPPLRDLTAPWRRAAEPSAG